MRILGLDEAGRGSVLGPMTDGAYCCEASTIDRLIDAGVTDSKLLTAKRRATIRRAITDMGEHAVTCISAAAIDAGNLNTLEEEAFAALIARFSPDQVIIDAPTHPRGIPNFKRRMAGRLAALGVPLPEMIVEPKADLNYPVVGAASIFAKTDRDAAVAALGPVGSGYPSDPTTRRWIMARLGEPGPLPACVRSRWGTIDNLRQQSLFSR